MNQTIEIERLKKKTKKIVEEARKKDLYQKH